MKSLVYKLKDLNDNIIYELIKHVRSRGFSVEESQVKSWRSSIRFLYEQLYEYKHEELYIIFEYFLPLEGGRRPDVLILYQDRVIILEFKNKVVCDEDDIQQAIEYREDIKNYHKYTIEHKLKVDSYIVLTKREIDQDTNGIKVLHKNNFKQYVNMEENKLIQKEEVRKFIESEYEPLPHILKATHDLFKEGRLPFINNIKDSEIEESYSLLKKIIFSNITSDNKKNIIFIGGVPGSGKTLIALKLLYKYNNWIKDNSEYDGKAIYISGNASLANVLQQQIGKELEDISYGKGYIKGAKDFKEEYADPFKVVPYNIILFDEAQRAWDEKKMNMSGVTQPGLLLRICNRIYKEQGNVNIVCLIGEGQYIHEGEEDGINLWANELMNNYKDYMVHMPLEFTKYFKGVNNINPYKSLYLNTSIRNNFIDTSNFIESILKCDKEKASDELKKIKQQGFSIKVSRKFYNCEKYVYKKGKEGLKYGIIVSSKSDTRYIKTVINKNKFTSYIDARNAGKWFLEDCTKLEIGASEFACQGLEIDLPIVIFADDYYIKKGKFFVNRPRLVRQIDKYKSPEQIMENIYRVLLSRSRKGMIIFIPNDRFLDETYNFFKDIGILDLD